MLQMIAQAANNVNMDGVTQFISSLGFPIFIAVWLLYRSHKDNQMIADAIDKLENAIIEIKTYIKTISEGK